MTPEKNFVDDLDIDSLSMVEIAVAAQDKFGVEIPDEQLKDLKTVQDVVNFVTKLLTPSDAGADPPSTQPYPESSSEQQRSVSVVVTGLGATTPLGGDVASTWSAMLAGPAGAPPDRGLGRRLPVKIAAPAAVDPAEVIARPQARRLDRCEQFASSRRARPGPTPGSPEVDPYRLGVAVTSGIGGISSTLAAYDTLREQGLEPHLAVSPCRC